MSDLKISKDLNIKLELAKEIQSLIKELYNWNMSCCRFHLAIAVKDIDEAKSVYCDFLGCEEGNSE